MNTNVNNDVDNNEYFFDIDYKTLIDSVLVRFKMIVVFALAFALSAFMVSEFVMTPKYRATITMCISNNKTMISDSLDFNDVNAGIALVPTYIELLKSNNVLEEVAAKTQDLGYDADAIRGMISISTIEGTQIISLNVINTNPEHANIIANAIANIAPEKVVDVMEGSSVKIIDESKLPTAPFSPNVMKNTLLGFMLGGCLGVALAILIALLDSTIKSESDINNIYPDIPILGVIPEIGNDSEENTSVKKSSN